MTCVVGVTDGSRVWMGGDSAGASGWSLSLRSSSKVFVRAPFVMGFTSSFRMGQLLRWSLQVAEPEGDLEQFMCTTFIDAVRKCLKDGGFAKKDADQEEGGVFLVGVAGRLFTVHSDYQVSEQIVSYAAVGCGDDIALGVMYATAHLAPEHRLQVALDAAERHSAGVRGPFTIVSTA